MEPTAKYKRGVIITLIDGLNAYLKADQPGDGETDHGPRSDVKRIT